MGLADFKRGARTEHSATLPDISVARQLCSVSVQHTRNTHSERSNIASEPQHGSCVRMYMIQLTKYSNVVLTISVSKQEMKAPDLFIAYVVEYL